MAIYDLIAQGGTQNPSPLDKYMKTRQFLGQELARKQQIDLNKQRLELAQQKEAVKRSEDYAKAISPILKRVNDLPPEQRQAGYQQVLPNLQQFAGQYGLPAQRISNTWDQTQAEALINRFYEGPKGDFINAEYQGKIVPAIETEEGVLVDPQSKEPLVGAIKAASRQVTGVPGELGTKTRAQAGKEIVDFENASIAALNAMDVADEAINLISKTPEIGGYSGVVIRGLNELNQTISNVAKTVRDDVGETFKFTDGKQTKIISREQLGDMYSDELSVFRKSAIHSQELESALINLGYMAAAMKGQTGRALSDTDLRLNMKEVGKITDPIAAQKVLKNFVSRAVNGLENTAKIKGYEGTKPINLVTDRLKKFTDEADNIPSPQTQEDFDALPSGSIYIDPDDGKQYRKP